MMTPGRHVDPNDPSSMAIALTALHGEVAMLQREVSTNIQNLTSSTQAIQAEQRHQSEQMGEIVRLQQQYLANSEALGRAFTEIARLSGETRTVQEAISDARGRFRGIWMAGSLVVVLGSAVVTLAWNQITGKLTDASSALSDAKAERAALEARIRQTHSDDVLRMQRQMDDTRARVEALEKTGEAR